MDIARLKNDFLEYLEIEKNRSPKTVENYEHYISRILDFLKAKSPSDITEDGIRKFRIHINRATDANGRPLKKVTQNYHIIALRSFLKYLAKRDIACLAPDKLELAKQEDREVTFLEKSELEKFLKSPDGDNLASLRDRAILETLFSTGLRVSELVSLNRNEIDFNRGEFSVRGKGSKLRVVFLSPTAIASIETYLSKRKDADPALFVRVPKDEKFEKYDELRLTQRSIQRIVKKHAIKAGIVGKKVSPHSLRHSYATDLLRNGADIRSVQAMLGHASVTTTQIYTHVTDAQLREVHDRFHGKKKS